MKASAVFVNLTAAYDTVWHRSLICKLPQLLSDWHIVLLIIKIVHNRCFTVTTGTGKQSWLQSLNNGVPQGSVLDPLLFNINTYDLLVIVGRKYAYADDLVILHYANDWQAIEGTLTQDMAILSSYPYQWNLKLTTTKTVSAAFYLYHKETRHELNIFVNGQVLPFCAEPTYLDIKLDRLLTFRRHLESLRKKLTFRFGILQRLAGSSWGANDSVFRTANLALVRFTAE